MKILLLNYTDAGGGAANGALLLTEALNEYGIDAKLGVVEKKTASKYVIQCELLKKSKLKSFFTRISSLFLKIAKKLRLYRKNFSTTNNILHSTNLKSKIDVNWINNSNFDVVHLHWINNDMISIKDISKITKPIVWTMHDSWPCCGAEHHPNILEEDIRFKNGYWKSNKPKSTKGKDICKKVWEEKKKYLMNKEITFIAPSNWEGKILKESFLFNKKECFVIPNIINQSNYYKKNKEELKKAFDIPAEKKIIGFGAAYDIDNKKSMKGSYYLIDCLKKLKDSNDYFLVIFGPAGTDFTKNISIPFFATGYISNQKILSSIYNLCDVIVNPSLIENLPYTCLESICCGIPVVAFDVGGTPDIVEHKKTGYLATPYKSEKLVEGIEYCINNKQILSQNCLQKAKTDFDTEKIVQKHLEVYENAKIN